MSMKVQKYIHLHNIKLYNGNVSNRKTIDYCMYINVQRKMCNISSMCKCASNVQQTVCYDNSGELMILTVFTLQARASLNYAALEVAEDLLGGMMNLQPP